MPVGVLHVGLKVVLPEADELAVVALELLEEDGGIVDALVVLLQFVPVHGREVALVAAEAESLFTWVYSDQCRCFQIMVKDILNNGNDIIVVLTLPNTVIISGPGYRLHIQRWAKMWALGCEKF